MILFLLFLLSCISFTVSESLYSVSVNGFTDRSSYQTMKDLALAYRLVNSDLTLSIEQATTPSTIQALISGEVDFGIGIQGWSPSIAASAPSVVMMPMFLSGFVPIYRIDALGPSADPVVFSRAAIVSLFTGECTTWSCPPIRAANPLISLPDTIVTMVFDVSGGARNALLKRAMYQFDAIKMANSSMQINNHVDYPFSLYANTKNASVGDTSLVSQVLAHDGSFAMSFYSSAKSLGVSIGEMVNKANRTVNLSEASVTFAAIELGISTPVTPTTAHVLTDGASEEAWPLSFFSYLLLDLTHSPSSCRSREYAVKFFLHTLNDNTALNIAANRGLMRIPQLILAQTKVIETLTTDVMCRGTVALPAEATFFRAMTVTPSFLFMANLFTSVYSDPDGTAKILPQIASDNVMVSQLVNSEVDLILVTPSSVDSVRWDELMNSGDYLAIPVFGTAPNLFFNRDLTSHIRVGDNQFLMDYSLMVKLLTGCVTDFNDSLILEQNPWLSSLTSNESIPIQKVLGCGTDADAAPLMNYVWQIVASLASTGLLSNEVLQCFAPSARLAAQTIAFEECKSNAEMQLTFTSNEMLAPSLALGTVAGYSVALADLDTNKLFPTLVKNINGEQVLVQSGVANILGCAYDTFDPTTLMFNFHTSNNASCWPLSQPVVAIVRKQYWTTPSITNSSSCDRGLDALQFLRWLVNEQQVKILTDSIGFAQLSTIPEVRDAYISALNAVLCDDETLLITLPIIWSLSGGLFGFAIAAAIVGMLFTNLLIVYVVVKHRHPIIRSASPFFMIVSLFGVQLLFGSVIALAMDATVSSCIALSWLVNCGLMVTFAPLFMRTYRIWRIFGRRKLSVVKITNRRLMSMVGAMFVFELVVLSVWQGVGQVKPVLHITQEGVPSRAHYYEQCSTEGVGDTLFGLVAAEKGLLLVCGALLAFSTRKVSSQFNESNQIALAIYNVLFSIGIIAPILVVIDATGDVRSALLMFVILWISFFTGGILVIPKALHIHGTNEEEAANSKSSSSAGFSFMSLDGLDNLPMIGSYLAALRRHVEQVEQLQTTLKSKRSTGESKRQATLVQSSTQSSQQRPDPRMNTYTSTASKIPIVVSENKLMSSSQSISQVVK